MGGGGGGANPILITLLLFYWHFFLFGDSRKTLTGHLVGAGEMGKRHKRTETHRKVNANVDSLLPLEPGFVKIIHTHNGGFGHMYLRSTSVMIFHSTGGARRYKRAAAGGTGGIRRTRRR